MSLSRAPLLFAGIISGAKGNCQAFPVWDWERRFQVALSAGMALSAYRIVSGATSSGEPYQVEFESTGRHTQCLELPAGRNL